MPSVHSPRQAVYNNCYRFLSDSLVRLALSYVASSRLPSARIRHPRLALPGLASPCLSSFRLLQFYLGESISNSGYISFSVTHTSKRARLVGNEIPSALVSDLCCAKHSSYRYIKFVQLTRIAI